jgi:hypothetical protein
MARKTMGFPVELLSKIQGNKKGTMVGAREKKKKKKKRNKKRKKERERERE